MKAASDHLPFAMAGVPSLSLDWLNHTPTWGVTHTPADTIEKVSLLNMRLVAVQVARVLLRLANEDAFPARPRSRDQMLAAYDEATLKAALELEEKAFVG
jgi:Iap family predicted aminopeptidase